MNARLSCPKTNTFVLAARLVALPALNSHAANVTVSTTTGEVNGNTAPSNGGAISVSSSLASHDLNITNCAFINNTATTAAGGAVNNVRTFLNHITGTQGDSITLQSGASLIETSKLEFLHTR